MGFANPELMYSAEIPYIHTIVQMLSVTHTCINPVIYCWMNSRVRHGFKEILGKQYIHWHKYEKVFKYSYIDKYPLLCLGKCSLIRKCCPCISWNNVNLTRTATGSVYFNENNPRKRQR